MLPIEYHEYRSKLNGMFTALACPNRRKVLEHLAREVTSPTEIAAEVGISPPTVIHHIRKLRECGLATPHDCGCVDYVDWKALRALVFYLESSFRH